MRRALEAAIHVALVNRGVLIAPFHNMMLVSPATTRRQVDRLIAAFGDIAANARGVREAAIRATVVRRQS